MAVYKDNATGTWRVIYRYTDWTGERKQTQKRGWQDLQKAGTADDRRSREYLGTLSTGGTP